MLLNTYRIIITHVEGSRHLFVSLPIGQILLELISCGNTLWWRHFANLLKLLNILLAACMEWAKICHIFTKYSNIRIIWEGNATVVVTEWHPENGFWGDWSTARLRKVTTPLCRSTWILILHHPMKTTCFFCFSYLSCDCRQMFYGHL